MKFRTKIDVERLPDFLEADYAIIGALYAVSDNDRSERVVSSISYQAFSKPEVESVKVAIRAWAKNLAVVEKEKMEGDSLSEDYDFEV